jgi:2-succinyl-6-hydroxy-2,4-cyclohexadiene-1-carboxylate synthase
VSATVVLLHGFAGAPRSWDAVARQLPSSLIAVTPELAGHGRTPIGEVRRFDDEVERLARIAAAIRGPRLLGGYSLGGRLALGLLLEHPGLFAGAVIAGAHGGLEEGAEGDEERAARRRSDEAWAERIEREGVAAFADAWSRQPLFASQAGHSPEAMAAQREVRLAHRAGDLAAAMRALSLAGMPCYRERLAELGVPVVLMAGELDAKFHEQARQLERRLERGRVVVVGGAGHNLPLEAPEAVARALERMACETLGAELRPAATASEAAPSESSDSKLHQAARPSGRARERGER